MARETFFVVQTFIEENGVLIAEKPVTSRSADGAQLWAQILAPTKAGVVALALSCDPETGERWADPVMLFESGEWRGASVPLTPPHVSEDIPNKIEQSRDGLSTSLHVETGSKPLEGATVSGPSSLEKTAAMPEPKPPGAESPMINKAARKLAKERGRDWNEMTREERRAIREELHKAAQSGADQSPAGT